jgi:hypothetical protein
MKTVREMRLSTLGLVLFTGSEINEKEEDKPQAMLNVGTDDGPTPRASLICNPGQTCTSSLSLSPLRV